MEAQASDDPHYRVFTFREWYLQSVWHAHNQGTHGFTLSALYDLSETYIRNFVIPNTGEDYETARARIASAFESEPSDIEMHTAAVLESYTAGECAGQLDGQCFMLEIASWAIAARVFDFNDLLQTVEATGYTPAWAAWDIPRPTAVVATPSPETTPTPVATSTPAADAPLTIAELVKQVQAGVVQVSTSDGSGSGFVIESNGLIVTNEHVVGSHKSVTVKLSDGVSYRGAVLGYDQVADLAAVKIDGSGAFHALALGDSDAVQVGQAVVALGYPVAHQTGQPPVVTQCIISAKRVDDGVKRFQTDAAINPGNSGGPLFDRSGQVIGVNTSGLDFSEADNVAFAVVVNELKSRLAALKSGQNVVVEAPTAPSAVTEGWLRYRNGLYGYSLDLPPGWTLVESSETPTFAAFIPPPSTGQAYTWVSVDKVSGLKASGITTDQQYANHHKARLEAQARANSWHLLEIRSLTRHEQDGDIYYDLVYREQAVAGGCILRSTRRIRLSVNGYAVETEFCERDVAAHESDLAATRNSFALWDLYFNNTAGYSLFIAPGWTLDDATHTSEYVSFDAPEGAANVEIAAYALGSSVTVEDFVQWRKDWLDEKSQSWVLIEDKKFLGIGGEAGARDEYILTYRAQITSAGCVSDNAELVAVSYHDPSKPIGYLMVTAVCEHSLALYDGDRWAMINSFIYRP